MMIHKKNELYMVALIYNTNPWKTEHKVKASLGFRMDSESAKAI